MSDAPHYIESTQPEIIRQNQTDEEYQYLMRSKLIDAMDFFMPWLINYRFLSKYKDEIKAVGSLLYFGLTTFFSEQTMGEEYTSLAQYVPSEDVKTCKTNKRGHPKISRGRRLTVVFLQSILPLISEKIIKKYYNILKNKSLEAEKKTLWVSFLRTLPDYDTLVSNLFKLHLCIFFLEGSYFQLSKRVTSIRYIFTKKPQDHLIEYRRIGVLMLIQIVVEIVKFFYKMYRNNKWKNVQERYFSKQATKEVLETIDKSKDNLCFICYEQRKNPSITPCGHVFCWECIVKNSLIREECPVCKKNCKPNKIIQLKNYT